MVLEFGLLLLAIINVEQECSRIIISKTKDAKSYKIGSGFQDIIGFFL